MNADVFETQLRAYLSLREALGFQMRAEKVLLPEFVAFVKAQGITGPIRTEMALAWACQASAHRGPSGAARRLSIARGFLRYLQASAPDTEVPAPGLLPAPRRPKPYLFTPTQLMALFEAAQASRPRGSLRPHTLSTLVGLLASTGLRVGEAIRLQVDHVKLELVPPQLHILETKFHKSRIIPLHPSTADRLRHYREQRAHLHYDGLSDAFFVLTGCKFLDTAERTQIDQRVRHQFHAVVSLLDAFKAEQQPLELVLPGKGPLNPQA